MSRRNMSKLFDSPKLLSSDDSDGEFDRQLAQAIHNSIFEELSLSSHSESHHDSSSDNDELLGACSIKAQKKKKKRRNRAKHLKRMSSFKNNPELDEIDRSLMEVNALLGSPTPPPEPLEPPRIDPRLKLMSIQNKYLNAENEMRRLMGGDNRAEERRRRNQMQGARVFRRNMIVNFPDKSLNFHGYGLSMSIEGRDGEITYFTYDHSEQYQKVHRAFLTIIKNTNINLLLSREQIQSSLHIEGMLEVADSFFMMEEYNQAELLLEKIIACLQYTTHPNFTLTNPNVRLEYKYLENRPFFTAILKYIYLLSNKSCHRTALELAKLLLNLDPSDPLKMFLVLDVLALRAREHQWLVDIVETMDSEEKRKQIMITLRYSYALAKFHVAAKQNAITSELDTLLQDVILNCPLVAKSLIDCFSGVPKGQFHNHLLFKNYASLEGGSRLVELTTMYAKMVSAKWREPAVMKWLMKNVNFLVETFTPEVQASISKKYEERDEVFKTWPTEVIRHMTVIKAMTDLIADGAVPLVKRTSSSNPIPPLGSIDRYKYNKSNDRGNRVAIPIWHEFFSSALPRHVNIGGVRPHWLVLRNIQECMLNTEIYCSNVEGAPYMVVPYTLLVFSMFFILLAITLKTLFPEVYGHPRELLDPREDNVGLD